MKPVDIEVCTKELIELAESLSGHLKKREVQFLACLPFVSCKGEILEIGSYKGKSTIILAKAVIAAGGDKIFACDPLSLSCSTDPDDVNKEDLPGIFYDNLKQYNVEKTVQFFQMKSDVLVESWDKPLKVLWVDGDHTYDGAMSDFMLFKDYLMPGAIVCFHDVLHGFDGPIRTFMEKIVLSDLFGDCGLCGSIGWGQFIGRKRGVSNVQWGDKLALYKKLSRFLPFVLNDFYGIKNHKRIKKIFRSLIPHKAINPTQWIHKINT